MVLEDTGYDSCICSYEVSNLKDYVGYTKRELEEALSVEFKKSFIMKYGKEN